MEEQNTVQGFYNDIENVDQSVFEINGKRIKLTENQFRSEKEIRPRNGYGSLPVCSNSDRRGCPLYNQYGDETCSMISNR